MKRRASNGTDYTIRKTMTISNKNMQKICNTPDFFDKTFSEIADQALSEYLERFP